MLTILGSLFTPSKANYKLKGGTKEFVESRITFPNVGLFNNLTARQIKSGETDPLKYAAESKMLPNATHTSPFNTTSNLGIQYVQYVLTPKVHLILFM